MKFILLIDNSTSTQKFVDAVETKIRRINDISGQNITLDVFVLHNGCAIDSDTNILLNILSNEKHRLPIILDAHTAKYHPDILKLQTSIVMFEHEMNNTLAINDYNSFNETLATAHGARIDYIDSAFHDIDNDKSLMVVDINKHAATDEYYVHLSMVFEHEMNHYPLILLPRFIQNECSDQKELEEAFKKREFYSSQINWNTTVQKRRFENIIEIQQQCCDMAIHSLLDKRLFLDNAKLHNKRI